MPAVLRAPVLADAEELARLHVLTWQQTYAGQLPAEYFSEDAVQRRSRMWRSLLTVEHPGLTLVVAAEASEIVGFAGAGPASSPDSPRDQELHFIYVERTRHGTGVGQALLDAALGERSAFLWVARDNPRARAFYERNRFVFDGIEQEDAEVPGFIELRMVR